MTSLQDILKKVPDPRSRQGLGKTLTRRQLRRLGFRPEHEPPSHPTLTEFMRYVDPDALAEALSALIPADGGRDPERARHCRDRREDDAGHESSRGKGMEIPDALNLIDRLDLQGMIVTGDAIFRRKSITSRIVGKGGDCVIPVKGNRASPCACSDVRDRRELNSPVSGSGLILSEGVIQQYICQQNS